MRAMTLETKVRLGLTVALIVGMAALVAQRGVIGVDDSAGWAAGAPFIGGLVGLLYGFYRRRDKPQPAPYDVEADWAQRAQSGAFLDLVSLAIPILLVVSYTTTWGARLNPSVVVLLLFAVAVVDLGVRHLVLRVCERG